MYCAGRSFPGHASKNAPAITLSLVRFAGARLFAAAAVTPELLAEATDDIIITLVRSEQARRRHRIAKNSRPPRLKNARTPSTPR